MENEEKKEETISIADEIASMNKAISDTPLPEKKEEKPEKKEEEKTEEPEEEETKEEEKEEEVKDDKDKIIEDLRSKLAAKEAETKKEEPEKKEEKKEEPKEEPLKLEEQDFIGDLDPEEIVRDKDSFNKLLNTIYSKGILDARKILGENILQTIPAVIRNNIEIIGQMKETKEKFYSENKDLKPFEKVVAAVFEELQSENVGKTYKEIIALVGPEARKRLGLQKKAMEKEKEEEEEHKAPRLPKKSSSLPNKHEKPNTSGLQDEIAEMNKFLGQ